MKALRNGSLFFSVAIVFAATLVGCGRDEQKPPGEGKDTLSARLTPEEQKAVEAQAYCPVSDRRLGSMGLPTKLALADDTIYLCCAGCEKEALANPKDTHSRVEELRLIQEQLARLGPEDRKLAAAQVFCVVMAESKLGSMGVPIKVMVEEQPVFVCCKGCVRQTQMNPKQTLARRAELLRKKV